RGGRTVLAAVAGSHLRRVARADLAGSMVERAVAPLARRTEAGRPHEPVARWRPARAVRRFVRPVGGSRVLIARRGGGVARAHRCGAAPRRRPPCPRRPPGPPPA